MLLTQAQIDFQAQKASWYVEVDYRNINIPGDPFIVTGTGVADLDRLIEMMPIYPNGRYRIDVGTTFEQYRPCDITDIQAIKAAYIAWYGNVNKPSFPTEQREAIEA